VHPGVVEDQEAFEAKVDRTKAKKTVKKKAKGLG
jgi:hypothetical protein